MPIVVRDSAHELVPVRYRTALRMAVERFVEGAELLERGCLPWRLLPGDDPSSGSVLALVGQRQQPPLVGDLLHCRCPHDLELGVIADPGIVVNFAPHQAQRVQLRLGQQLEGGQVLFGEPAPALQLIVGSGRSSPRSAMSSCVEDLQRDDVGEAATLRSLRSRRREDLAGLRTLLPGRPQPGSAGRPRPR